MKYKYVIKIVTKYLETKFQIESDTEINTVEEVHKPIIDFLGKSDIVWEKNNLHYTSSVNDFYITYEEVANGSGQHGIVRKETETRV